jgi:RNA binding exosome subunit
MEDQDYTNPIVEESTKDDIQGSYGDNPVAASVDAKLARQRQRRDSQLEQIRARQDEEDARQETLRNNPNPFEDEADYFGLITTGKIGDSLESLDYLDVDVSLKGKDYYWKNDKVKEKFIEQYGEEDAEDMFNVMYEEVDKQYYNHIAKHSMLSRSGLNTAIFVEEMEGTILVPENPGI